MALPVYPRYKTHLPIPGVDGVITVAADSEQVHVLRYVAYSYDSDPTIGTPGNIKVSINEVDVLNEDVTLAGPKALSFDDGLYGNKNEVLVITLLGLPGKTGRLNALVD